MLDSPAVPASLMAVLEDLNVFTAPSFATFTAMVTGLVADTRARTVTGMLTGAGLARARPHGRLTQARPSGIPSCLSFSAGRAEEESRWTWACLAGRLW